MRGRRMAISYQRFCEQCKRPQLAIYLPLGLGVGVEARYTCGECIEDIMHNVYGNPWKGLVTKCHQLKRHAARAS